jgi:hypothetical protein
VASSQFTSESKQEKERHFIVDECHRCALGIISLVIVAPMSERDRSSKVAFKSL